ncbi:hypothetical protein [Thermoleptolyngbya sp.]
MRSLVAKTRLYIGRSLGLLALVAVLAAPALAHEVGLRAVVQAGDVLDVWIEIRQPDQIHNG